MEPLIIGASWLPDQVDVSNNAIQLANNWLAGMRSLTTLAPLKAIENSAKQGQAVMFNPEELPNVPAPAAAVNLAALGLVFGGWFGFRRSRANRRQVASRYDELFCDDCERVT